MATTVKIRPTGNLATTNWTIEQGNGAGVPPNHWTAVSDSKPTGSKIGSSQWTRITTAAVLGSDARFSLGTYALEVTERCRRVRVGVIGQGIACRFMCLLGNQASGVETLGRVDFTRGNQIIEQKFGPWVNKAVGNVEWTQIPIDDLKVRIDALSAHFLGRIWIYEIWVELDIVEKPAAFSVAPFGDEIFPTTTPTLRWNHQVPEPQKKYEIRVFTQSIAEDDTFDINTSTSYLYRNAASTTAKSHRVPAGLLQHGEFYYVYVRTAVDFAGADWWSDWDDGTRFKINAKPEVTVTAPVSPVVDTAKPVITWNYDDEEGDLQSGFQVIMLAKPFGGWPGSIDPEAESLAGDAVHDSGFVASVGTDYELPVALENGETYRAYVRVQQRVPSLLDSEWGFIEFDTAFQAPPIPAVGVVPGSEAIEVTITPTNPNLLSADGSSFETATGGWTTETNNTIAQSAAQFLDGTKSLAITRTTSTGTAFSKSAAPTGGAPVIVGETYTASAYFRPNTTARSARVDLEFMDAANTVIQVVQGQLVTEVTGQWVRASVSAVPIVGAVRVRMVAAALNAVNGEVHYIDQTQINLGGLGLWNLGGGTIGLTLDVDSSAMIETLNKLTANQSSLETDASGWFPGSNTSIARSNAQAAPFAGTWSLLMTRNVSTGDATANTHKPPSTPNFLTAAQSDFESGVSTWIAGTNTTLGTSSAQFLEGANSLLVTRNTSVGSGIAFSDALTGGVTVTPGEVYQAHAYFRNGGSSGNCQVGLEFIDAGNAVVLALQGNIVNTVNPWVRSVVKATAPATAVRVRVQITISSMAVAEFHYVDKVLLFTGSEVMPCLANQEYSAVASWRAVSTGRTCTINFEFFDHDGLPLTFTDLSLGTKFVTNNNSGWTLSHTRVVSPPDAKFMSITLVVSGAASGEGHYADALGIFEGNVATWAGGRGRALDIADNMSFTLGITLLDWLPEEDICLVDRWDFEHNEQSSWALWLQPDGKLRFDVSTDGTEALKVGVLSTASLAIPAGTKKFLRITHDPLSTTSQTAFFTGDTLAGATTALGSTVVTSELLKPFNGYADLHIDGRGMESGGWQGYAYEFEMRDATSGGNILTYQDFGTLPIGMTQDVDAQGNLWILTGEAELEFKEKPNADFFNVERSRDSGDTWENFRYDDGLVFSDLVPGSFQLIRILDREVPVNVSVKYRAQSISRGLGFDSNSMHSAEVSATLPSSVVWIKDTIDPTKNRHFRVTDEWLQTTHTRNRAVYQPLGRDKPVVIRGSGVSDTLSVTFILTSFEEHEILHNLIDSDHLLFLQTPKGSWWVEVSADMSLRAHLWDKLKGEEDLFLMTVPFQEVDRLRGEDSSANVSMGGHG